MIRMQKKSCYHFVAGLHTVCYAGALFSRDERHSGNTLVAVVLFWFTLK